MVRHDEVGAHEAAARREEATDERRRDTEGRVGNDAKRLTGEPQVAGVGQDDHDALVGEALPQLACPPVVQLDGDDPGARSHKGCREGTGARADVEHELTGSDGRLLDKAGRPAAMESVVPPPRGFPPGHGGP